MQGPGAPGDAAGLCALELAARRAAHASAESLSRRALAAQLGRPVHRAASLRTAVSRATARTVLVELRRGLADGHGQQASNAAYYLDGYAEPRNLRHHLAEVDVGLTQHLRTLTAQLASHSELVEKSEELKHMVAVADLTRSCVDKMSPNADSAAMRMVGPVDQPYVAAHSICPVRSRAVSSTRNPSHRQKC
jgi:hypothetical protein